MGHHSVYGKEWESCPRMSKLEYVSPEGLRLDGRRAKELRRIKCSLGSLAGADGSAYFQQGNTKVLATVHGPRQVKARRDEKFDRASIACEYSMAPFSTGERKKKGGGRRAREISMLIRQTFEAVIQTELYSRSQINIHVQVLQADGGTRCAAINAACLALIDAGIAMKDFVCACAAGWIEGTALLDLNYVEDGAGGPDIPLALLPKSNTISMLQMDSKLNLEEFEECVQLAAEGCHTIYKIMLTQVEQHAKALISRRGVTTAT